MEAMKQSTQSYRHTGFIPVCIFTACTVFMLAHSFFYFYVVVLPAALTGSRKPSANTLP